MGGLTAPPCRGTVVGMGDNVKLGQVITGDNGWLELLDLPIGTILVDEYNDASQVKHYSTLGFFLAHTDSDAGMCWIKGQLCGDLPRTALRVVWIPS